jgi:hypothetical protein
MKMMAMLLAVIGLGLAGSLRAADVVATGKWKAEFEAGGGQMKYTYDLKVEGDKVTGKALRDRDGDKAEVELQDGKLNGDQISFVELAHIGDQDIRIEYKGKVEGDEMKLSRTVGDFGSSDIVAKREKMASIDGKWTSEFDSQVGHQNYTYDFKVDGEKLTGKVTRSVDDQKTETDITEGKITGDALSFVEVLKIPDQDQDIRIEYKGKVAGDQIKLTRAVGEFATNEIVAVRAKDSK